jgi:hypothetical protein
MVPPEKIIFFVFLFYKTSHSESSYYSSELEVIIPGKEARKGQGKKNEQSQPPGREYDK